MAVRQDAEENGGALHLSNCIIDDPRANERLSDLKDLVSLAPIAKQTSPRDIYWTRLDTGQQACQLSDEVGRGSRESPRIGASSALSHVPHSTHHIPFSLLPQLKNQKPRDTSKRDAHIAAAAASKAQLKLISARLAGQAPSSTLQSSPIPTFDFVALCSLLINCDSTKDATQQSVVKVSRPPLEKATRG